MNREFLDSTLNVRIRKEYYRQGFVRGLWTGFAMSSIVITILLLIIDWGAK